MLKQLFDNPDSGLLGATFALTWQGPLVVQYWSSVDKLMSCAADRSAKHYPAWAAFGAARNFESIYVNMPPFGLSRVGELGAGSRPPFACARPFGAERSSTDRNTRLPSRDRATRATRVHRGPPR
ncbi:MAG TPA: DUF4188 domain-containing protein [Polyangiaceae bacterium]|nr:DUF4188 domain-containing protein [Polyangiaceae bacterium]